MNEHCIPTQLCRDREYGMGDSWAGYSSKRWGFLVEFNNLYCLHHNLFSYYPISYIIYAVPGKEVMISKAWSAEEDLSRRFNSSANWFAD